MVPAGLSPSTPLRVPLSDTPDLSSRPERPRHEGRAGAAPYLAALCVRRPAWALLACGGTISEGKSASLLGRGTEREA